MVILNKLVVVVIGPEFDSGRKLFFFFSSFLFFSFSFSFFSYCSFVLFLCIQLKFLKFINFLPYCLISPSSYLLLAVSATRGPEIHVILVKLVNWSFKDFSKRRKHSNETVITRVCHFTRLKDWVTLKILTSTCAEFTDWGERKPRTMICWEESVRFYAHGSCRHEKLFRIGDMV